MRFTLFSTLRCSCMHTLLDAWQLKGRPLGLAAYDASCSWWRRQGASRPVSLLIRSEFVSMVQTTAARYWKPGSIESPASLLNRTHGAGSTRADGHSRVAPCPSDWHVTRRYEPQILPIRMTLCSRLAPRSSDWHLTRRYPFTAALG